MTERDPEPPKTEPSVPSHLRPLRLRGGIGSWSLVIAIVSGLCLFLVTGLAASPWLFLLYPLLIGGLVFGLGVFALRLLSQL